ncbi:hypothetical protein FACS189418_4660 [Clostridia bacterium]|nr:hypothetical protein FACS189418_4660 [Clostridia bacterium]
MKKNIILGVAVLSILSVTACAKTTNTENVQTTQKESAGQTTKTKEIEDSGADDTKTKQASEQDTDDEDSVESEILWNEVQDEAEVLEDKEFYPYARGFRLKANEKTKVLELFALVADDTSPEDALGYANTIVRQVNEFAWVQNNEISRSSENYYGGIYETYTVKIGVSSTTDEKDSSKWFVNQTIEKGTPFQELTLQHKS